MQRWVRRRITTEADIVAGTTTAGTETAGTAATREHTTERGDAEGHRRDILRAAAEILVENNWVDFSIRDVAARAGVSPGAVYQWFAGKDEIIANLQAARLHDDAADVRQWPDDMAPDVLATRLTFMLTTMYAEIGRLPVDPAAFDSRPAAQANLAAARHDAIAAVNDKVSRVMQSAGRRLPDLEARLSWLWASARGIADLLVEGAHDTHGVSRDDFLRVAGARTAAGFLAVNAPAS